MLVDAKPSRVLGNDHPRVVFGEEAKASGSWAGRRSLQLDGKPAFEVSYWCGTCQFFFRRLEGANQTLSISELDAILAEGLEQIDDDVLTTFAELLPIG